MYNMQTLPWHILTHTYRHYPETSSHTHTTFGTYTTMKHPHTHTYIQDRHDHETDTHNHRKWNILSYNIQTLPTRNLQASLSRKQTSSFSSHLKSSKAFSPRIPITSDPTYIAANKGRPYQPGTCKHPFAVNSYHEMSLFSPCLKSS